MRTYTSHRSEIMANFIRGFTCMRSLSSQTRPESRVWWLSKPETRFWEKGSGFGIPNFYRAMHVVLAPQHGIAIVCRPSVHLSVRL